jgi:predicted dehydrogenase
MNDKIRLGLIGYGKVATLYAEAIRDIPNAVLVSVCGRNKERRDEFAAKWGLASRATAEDMARQDKVDAAIVVTPHPQHCDGALAAFDAGLHVLVEKPMAVSVAQCDRMSAAAQRAGKALSVVSQRRWFPACRRVREAIDSGKLGRPAILQMTVLGWRDEKYYGSDPWRGKWQSEGGGVLINQVAHQIDLMCWFMGPVAEVQGFWGNVNHPYIEVEDTAVAALRFENGGFGSVLASNSQKPGIHAKVHVHGASGASAGVQTDGGAMFIAGMSTITEPPVNDLWTIPGEEALLEKFRAEDEAFFKTIDATTHFFARQIEAFCAAILQGKTPPVTAADGRETVKFIETMYRLGGAPGY